MEDQTGTPPFQLKTCQFILSRDGVIVSTSDDAADKLALPIHKIEGKPLRDILLAIYPNWEELLPQTFSPLQEPLYLPLLEEDKPLAIGISLHCLECEDHLFITLHPELAPQQILQSSSIADFNPQGETIAQMFLRLQLSESRLNNYMQNFPGIFFCQRPDLSFTYVGSQLADTIGHSTDSFLKNGGAFLQQVYSKDRDIFLQELEKNSLRSKTFSLSYRMKHAQNDSILYFLDVRTPLHSPTGLLLGYEGVWLDISRQAIAENRLTSTSWKENLATITSGLVHDFSNVMAGIYSLSEIYHDSLDESHTMYEGLNQIKKNAMQAQKLVRRIIDLNREQTGQRDYHNLEYLVRDQIELIQIILSKHAQIETQFTGEELAVYVDEVEFRQVLLNLAMNARDAFGDDQCRQINIEVCKTSQGTRPFQNNSFIADKNGVCLRFQDNGCGIEPKHLQKIFTPYFTTKEASKGSGFGLYNAKLFVDKNHGSIHVSSDLGKGTVFEIYLPLADFTEMDAEFENETKLSRRYNLLIYASQDSADFEIVNLMRQKEWQVISFDNTNRAKEHLKETEFLPHMAFAIDIGHDTQINNFLSYLKEDFPGIKTGALLLGRNPDDQQMPFSVDLLASEADSSAQIVQDIEELLS